MAFTRIIDPTNNISNLANQPVEPPATLKQKFDQIGEDLKDYVNNTFLPELESTTNGDSGADNIGATALSGGVATTVQGILEELDEKAVSGSGALNTHKTSSDHDGRYYTETEVNVLLLANQQGNHLGTWQGLTPTLADPGIAGVVAEHTMQLADIAKVFVNIINPPSPLVAAVGDGVTDDTVAIQAIIDYVATLGGGTVIVPSDGTFIFTRLTNKNKVRLFGTGGILKLKDNTCVNGAVSYYLLDNIGYNNCTYEGLLIDGNRANNGTYLVADGITVGGENSHVKNCWLYNIPDSGIMFSGAKNSSLVNNRIDVGGDVGIYVNDGDGTNHYENIIAFNRITGFPSGGIALKRICQRTIVGENTIFDCGNGITLEQASTATDYSKNLTITCNRIRNVTTTALDVRSSPYCVVIGNRVENFGTVGLHIQGDTNNSTFIGNVISSDGSVVVGGTYKSGILLSSRQGIYPSFNTIEGNVIDITNLTADNILALYLLSLEAKVSGGNNNIINGNSFKSTATYGGRITSAYTKNNISNNTFKGNTNDFYNNGSLQNVIANNDFINNNPLAIDITTETYLQKIGIQRITRSNLIPTTGTWAVGDRCVNTTPTVGQPKAWACTATGTPGTWVSEGNL